jgi:imidazolonepropionase-like amidohydrolase
MHTRSSRRSVAFVLLLASGLGACGSPLAATTPVPSPRAPRAEVELAPLPWLAEQSPRWVPPATPTTVLRGGTVMTAAGNTITHGVVVMEGGLVRAVGAEGEVAIPAGATVVDTTGRFVTPGIIDSHSHMGVYAAPGVNATSDGNEATSPVTAEVRAEDSFWPQDPALGRALAAGVTTIQVLPGSANLIGGRGVVMKLHLGRSAAEMRFPEAPDTLKIACGENPKRVYGERHGAPSTRMGNAAGYRRAFQQAVEYARAWRTWQHGQRQWRVKKDAYDAAVRAAAESVDAGAVAVNAGDAGTPALPDDPGPEPSPPARDRGLEALVGVIEGRTLVQNHCYRADEMLTMLAIGREFGFRIRSFHHAVEAYKIRDVLAAEDVSVSTWADWWGFKLEAFDSVEQNLALLEHAGVRAIMHSDSAMLVQRLAQEAAKAVRAAEDVGLPPVSDDRALRWVTANPAWALGVDRMTGTLEPGKMADVVVWSASPFSVYARAERVYVDGRLAFERGAPDPFAGTDFEVGLTLPEAAATTTPATATGSPERAPAAVPATTLAEAYARRPRGAVFGGALTLVHARVLVGDGTRVDDATLVVRDGRIVSVTAEGVAPAATPDAPVIDATGLTITPGFVGVGHALGLVEIDLEPSTADLAPESDADPIRAAFSAADGYNPSSVLVPVARLGGVTSALSTPQGGLVAGTSAWVDLAGARPDDALVAPLVALHVDLDDGGVEAGGGARPAMLGRFRDALEDARLYAAQRAAYERRGLRELSVSRADLERLAEALSGRVPVVVRVARADDILRVLALARTYRLRLVLSGVEEGWKVADAIAAAGAPCIVQPLANLPERFARLGTRYDNAALLARAGVRLILTTDGPHGLRNLRQEAGNAVADGLDPAVALRALTSEPARVFGLGAEVGTLAPGRVANLAAWTGDPFELRTRLAHLIVRGRALPLRSRQTELFERYRTLDPVRRGRPAPRAAAR